MTQDCLLEFSLQIGMRGVVNTTLLLLPTSARSFFQAHIQFKPTLSQQQKSPEKQDTVLDGNFIVRYDVDRTASGGSIQVCGLQARAEPPKSLSTLKDLSLGILEEKTE